MSPGEQAGFCFRRHAAPTMQALLPFVLSTLVALDVTGCGKQTKLLGNEFDFSGSWSIRWRHVADQLPKFDPIS